MIRVLLLSFTLFFAGCASRPAEFDEHALYKKMRDASLVLLVNGKENGSAAFISEDGYIVSASHCIKFRDDKLEVISPKLGKHKVKLIALDKTHDMMLLKADLGNKKAIYLPPATERPKTPEKVYQIGSPIYRRGVVQSGFIARDDTYFEYYGDRHNHYIEIIHISVSIQSGTSGGPWVNRKGEYIGVQSGTLLVGDSPSGIAFMSPVTEFLDVIKSKKSARSFNLDFKVMPLETHNPSTIERYKGYSSGLVVADIKEDSVAKKAGIKKWDLIVAIDEHPVKTTAELMKKVRELKKTQVDLTIVELDSSESKTKSVPTEIVEDRVKFKSPPREVAEKKAE